MSKMKDMLADIMDLYYEGMSVKQIASQLHISTSLVRSAIDEDFESDYNDEPQYAEYIQQQGNQ